MTRVHHIGPHSENVVALPIVGLLTADWELGAKVTEELADAFGGIACWGERVPFDGTDYYAPEMGSGLSRSFCSFSRLMDPKDIVRLKIQAWNLEKRQMTDGKRRINLDPGYIDLGKVILASFKGAPHKLYLGEAIYADMVMRFHDGKFTALPWAFPDLIDSPHVKFFDRARAQLKELLKTP